jgi:hypothetical protein
MPVLCLSALFIYYLIEATRVIYVNVEQQSVRQQQIEAVVDVLISPIALSPHVVFVSLVCSSR